MLLLAMSLELRFCASRRGWDRGRLAGFSTIWLLLSLALESSSEWAISLLFAQMGLHMYNILAMWDLHFWLSLQSAWAVIGQTIESLLTSGCG